jgi:hypothetical protein
VDQADAPIATTGLARLLIGNIDTIVFTIVFTIVSGAADPARGIIGR